MVAGRAEEAEVPLGSEVDAALPEIEADLRATKQILLNLLSNAIKFTPRKGAVRVRAMIEPDGQFALSVVDTGIGIAPHDLERIREPFTQVDSGLGRRHEGTGLGL